MKFFKQNTRDEYNEQVWRYMAEEDEHTQARQEIRDAVDRRRIAKAKDGARDQQWKHCQTIYDSEIVTGERSPGGTKQKKRKVSSGIYILNLETKFV